MRTLLTAHERSRRRKDNTTICGGATRLIGAKIVATTEVHSETPRKMFVCEVKAAIAVNNCAWNTGPYKEHEVELQC